MHVQLTIFLWERYFILLFFIMQIILLLVLCCIPNRRVDPPSEAEKCAFKYYFCSLMTLEVLNTRVSVLRGIKDEEEYFFN